MNAISQRFNAPFASSALVERIFSAASNVYGKRRINLKPDYVESMMRIKIIVFLTIKLRWILHHTLRKSSVTSLVTTTHSFRLVSSQTD